MRYYKVIKSYKKQEYVDAICDACDYLKSRASDMMGDIDDLTEVIITFNIKSGELVALTNTRKLHISYKKEDSDDTK